MTPPLSDVFVISAQIFRLKKKPRVQKQTTVSPELNSRWRNGVLNTSKIPNKLQNLEAALASLGWKHWGILQGPRWIVCRAYSLRPERLHGNAPWPRRAPCRKVGGRRHGREDHTMLSVGAAVAGSSSTSPTKSVAELEQQITALVQRDAFPNEEEKSSDPQTSTEFARDIRDTRCQTPCRTHRGRRCVARGRTRFTVRHETPQNSGICLLWAI